MLEEGEKAPSFELHDSEGNLVRSEDLKGERYVLFFYPKDNTPGCTKEVCSFRDTEFDVPVFGVSTDDVNSHKKFSEQHKLDFPLLADPEAKLSKKYGVYGEKSFMGNKYMANDRATYVIDESGTIEKVWPKVKPEKHAEEVKEYIDG